VNISKALKKMLITWFVVLAFCSMSYFLSYDFYAVFISVLIFSAYIFNLKLFDNNFTDKSEKLWAVPLLYCIVLILVSLVYAIPVLFFNAIKPSATAFESFYFCIITLTTVGYGELSPNNFSGQVLSISMALVGTVHMIMFISILISKLRKDG
jgi:voltage-gated potassium channel